MPSITAISAAEDSSQLNMSKTEDSSSWGFQLMKISTAEILAAGDLNGWKLLR